MAEQQKVCGFQVGGALAQFLHANAAVFEHTAFSVYVADGGFCGWNPGKARHEIVRHRNLPSYSALLSAPMQALDQKAGRALEPRP
jgi:hypothetical protein